MNARRSPPSAQPAWERSCAVYLKRRKGAPLLVRKRTGGRALSRERSRPASAGRRSAGAQKCKETTSNTRVSVARRQGGVRGGSRRGLPPRAAARSAAVGGTQRRGAVWRMPKRMDPADTGQTRRGVSGARAEAPPHRFSRQTSACRTPKRPQPLQTPACCTPKRPQTLQTPACCTPSPAGTRDQRPLATALRVSAKTGVPHALPPPR